MKVTLPSPCLQTGLAFLKEQYVLLEDVYYSVGLKAYIDCIITMTTDLIR